MQPTATVAVHQAVMVIQQRHQIYCPARGAAGWAAGLLGCWTTEHSVEFGPSSEVDNRKRKPTTTCAELQKAGQNLCVIRIPSQVVVVAIHTHLDVWTVQQILASIMIAARPRTVARPAARAQMRRNVIRRASSPVRFFSLCAVRRSRYHRRFQQGACARASVDSIPLRVRFFREQ